MVNNSQSNAASIDVSRLAADLAKQSGRDFTDVAREIVADAAYQVQLLAAQYAPRRTGALAQSIVTEFSDGGLTAEVYPTAPYAGYMEYGTGTRGEYGGHAYVIRPKTAKALRFTINGKVVYAKKVTVQGISPRPFMRPAAERVETSLAAELSDNAVKFIVNTPGGKQ